MDSHAPAREHRLTIVPDELQASMVCAMLESHGIPSAHRRTSAAGVDWGEVAIGMSGFREILVPADMASEAAQLLESLEEASDSPVPPGEPSEASRHDPEAELALERARRLKRAFAMVALAIIGLPIVAAGAWQLTEMARLM